MGGRTRFEDPPGKFLGHSSSTVIASNTPGLFVSRLLLSVVEISVDGWPQFIRLSMLSSSDIVVATLGVRKNIVVGKQDSTQYGFRA